MKKKNVIGTTPAILLIRVLTIIRMKSDRELISPTIEGRNLNRIWAASGVCLLVLATVCQCFGYSARATESVYDAAPGFEETATFAIGTCAVGVVCVQPPRGNWTEAMEEDCLLMVNEALEYFENLSGGCMNFVLFEVKYRVPITHDPAEEVYYSQWVSETMRNIGFDGSNDMEQSRRYVNDLRSRAKTDWAICVLMVDLAYAPDENFGFGNMAFASALGGPYVAYRYHWDESRLVLVHEIAHLFWATDEYTGGTEYSGYLNVPDLDGAECLMNSFAYTSFCNATREQIGWRDSDGNGVMDIIDNKDNTIIYPYIQNPTTDRVLTYNGISSVIPYPSQNPKIRSVTTTKIVNVEFRVDNGTWHNATPTDGQFDGQVEEFYFVTSELEVGSHTVEVRSLNTINNSDESWASENVLIIGEDEAWPRANFTCPDSIAVGHPALFNGSASSSPNSSISSYTWNFGDGNITSTSSPHILHAYNSSGKYTVILNVTDNQGLWAVKIASTTVRSLADINGDGVVNILDVFIVANAFGSNPGHPRWNPTADINEDGTVDILDIFAVARTFGSRA